MNASDERNVESFKLQLEAATQMRSVVSSSPAPNCLIIDEIDGAPPVRISQKTSLTSNPYKVFFLTGLY